jgi:hypothetical protein
MIRARKRCPENHRNARKRILDTFVSYENTGELELLWCPRCGAIRLPEDERWKYPSEQDGGARRRPD